MSKDYTLILDLRKPFGRWRSSAVIGSKPRGPEAIGRGQGPAGVPPKRGFQSGRLSQPIEAKNAPSVALGVMRESDTIAVVRSGEWKRIEDAPKLKYVHVEGTWTKDERGRRRGPKPSEVRALRAPFEVIALRYPPAEFARLD